MRGADTIFSFQPGGAGQSIPPPPLNLRMDGVQDDLGVSRLAFFPGPRKLTPVRLAALVRQYIQVVPSAKC